MNDLSPGDLVFLTQAYENYVFERHPDLKVGLVNRLAKLESVIDWNSESGKKIMAARLKSGKWKDFPIEDCKYMFSIYYHELAGREGKKGVIETTPLFSKDPKTGEAFFIKAPDWLMKDILAKSRQFEVKDPD